NKGISLANLGNVQEALDCFNKAIELNPNLAKAWYNKGLILFKLNRVNEAEFCAKEALRIDPQYDKAKELERLCRVCRANF
ncbi:MAG: tetratricopeptide repeat protein, partial [Candidatus Bathyarchaeia archaeon]